MERIPIPCLINLANKCPVDCPVHHITSEASKRIGIDRQDLQILIAVSSEEQLEMMSSITRSIATIMNYKKDCIFSEDVT